MTATDESNTDKTASEVDLEKIIAELDAGKGRLPRDAIRAARGSRERVVPKLIDVVRLATAEARSGTVPEGNAHFFALFLLAEFRAKKALPARRASSSASSLPGVA